MKRVYIGILGLMTMIGATGYALEEPQGFIDVYMIPTKNHEHRGKLDIMHESSRNGARMIMDNDRLVATMIQMGRYELARYMRERANEEALEFQEVWRHQAQQELKRWGYAV